MIFLNACANAAIAQKRVGDRNRSDKLTSSSASFLDESRRKFLLRFKTSGYIINTDTKPIAEVYIEVLNIFKFHYDLRLMFDFFKKTNRKSLASNAYTFFGAVNQNNNYSQLDDAKKYFYQTGPNLESQMII